MHLATASLVCQPIGEGLHKFPLFLLVDTQGLVYTCAGQAVARGIWPASFRKTKVLKRLALAQSPKSKVQVQRRSLGPKHFTKFGLPTTTTTTHTNF